MYMLVGVLVEVVQARSPPASTLLSESGRGWPPKEVTSWGLKQLEVAGARPLFEQNQLFHSRLKYLGCW